MYGIILGMTVHNVKYEHKKCKICGEEGHITKEMCSRCYTRDLADRKNPNRKRYEPRIYASKKFSPIQKQDTSLGIIIGVVLSIIVWLCN